MNIIIIINKLYTECQHGFRKHLSCVTQLLEVMEDFILMLDNREAIDIVYLGYKKAFNSAPHQILLIKLGAYGVTGSILNGSAHSKKAYYKESEFADRYQGSI